MNEEGIGMTLISYSQLILEMHDYQSDESLKYK